jgi:hypothetical protein
MNTLDERLANRLHDIVDGEPDSTPPTGVLLERGRRARHRRTTAVVSATCAVLALGVATAAAVATAPATVRTPSSPGVTAEASSPRLELASAIAASENISYKVKVTSALKDLSSNSWLTAGAFDPATATGYLHSPYQEGPGFYEERLIDGVRFAGEAGIDRKVHWKQYPGKQDRLNYDLALNGVLGASADPDQLLKALRQEGVTITQTRAGTYHFKSTTSFKDAKGAGTVTVVGDVTLDADKRIAKVIYDWTSESGQYGSRAQDDKRGQKVHIRVAMEFSDYGTPVTVERPTDVAVVK